MVMEVPLLGHAVPGLKPSSSAYGQPEPHLPWFRTRKPDNSGAAPRGTNGKSTRSWKWRRWDGTWSVITVRFRAGLILLRAPGRAGNLDVHMGTTRFSEPGEDGDCDEHS
jgi:hypothetical protein